MPFAPLPSPVAASRTSDGRVRDTREWRKRVLVIGGRVQVRGDLVRILRGMGLDVDETSDAAGAVLAIQELGPPDLICADLTEGLIGAMRSCLELEGVPILVLAPVSAANSIGRAISAGASSVLSWAHFNVKDFREVALRQLQA